MHIDGECQCGQVTYEADIEPGEVSICHCTDCQRLTGTAYRVTVSAPRKRFHITSGEPKLYVKTADNGRRRASISVLTAGRRSTRPASCTMLIR